MNFLRLSHDRVTYDVDRDVSTAIQWFSDIPTVQVPDDNTAHRQIQAKTTIHGKHDKQLHGTTMRL